MTAMTLIESKTLGTATASIEFTSIPQDGTDLLVLASITSTRNNVYGDGLEVRPNGLTTNFSGRRLLGLGSGSPSSNTTGDPEVGFTGSTATTANTFANTSVYITNYTAAVAKSFSGDTVSENNGTDAAQAIYSGLWNQTTAITSLTLIPDVGPNLVAGSTVSLYKITKGSDGIVTTS
jgi:hypothetical protein